MNSPLIQALAEVPAQASGLVVAYSGGRDSSVLLHTLTHADLSIGVRAVHVCHHLEPEAGDWARHCRRVCSRWQVHFTCLDVQVPATAEGLEARARSARYEALAAELTPGEVLVTAHHAQDQAETFLLQALRGSGVAGLAAMPAWRPLGKGWHWRPWLSCARSRIDEYGRTYELDWVEDKTNHDPNRARGYLRNHIWPQLLNNWPSAMHTLARSAAWAAQASEAIETLGALDLEQSRQGDTLIIEALRALSKGRRHAVVQQWLAEQGRALPDHRHYHELERLLEAREHSSPRVEYAATAVRRFNGRLFAMPRLPPPPAPGTSLAWRNGRHLILPEGCGALQLLSSHITVWPPDLRVRFGTPGERLLLPDGRRRLLSEQFRLARVPPWIRERIPRLYVDEVLIAIPGLWNHPTVSRRFGGRVPTWYWQHEMTADPLPLDGGG